MSEETLKRKYEKRREELDKKYKNLPSIVMVENEDVEDEYDHFLED